MYIYMPILIYRALGSGAGEGCETKTSGMHGRRFIVTSCYPISQRYPRLCILEGEREAAAPISSPRSRSSTWRREDVPYL